MERIKVLTRLIAMIAAVMMLFTWIEPFYARNEAAMNAYDDFQTHMRSIYDKLNDGTSEYEALISEKEFQTGIQEEALKERVALWMEKSAGNLTYGRETMEEVKDNIIQLYHNQRSIAKDETYERYTSRIRMICVIVIAISGAIIWIITYQKKQKEKTDKQKTKLTKDIQKKDKQNKEAV